ncbi:MAG TPA: T9SS type A sorting domain-containing protein [Bacteroidales bacterium]|nr:T9SS type A sorting domain-containing protein [Bacteroidales bacterium]
MKRITLFLLITVGFGISNLFSQVAFQKLYSYGLPSMAIAWSVQQTSDGGYIMSGFQNKLPPYRAELIKTDANGVVSWAKSYGVSTTSPPLPLFENPLAIQTPFCTRQTSDGGYIICGQLDSKCYLMKVNSTGTTVAWTKQYAANSAGNMVKQLTDGSYIITGYINDAAKNDSTSIYLAKVTSGGALSWDKMIRISSNDDDMGNSVEIVSDGFVVTGYTTQIFGNDTTNDIVLLKTDLNGNVLWTKTFGEDLYSEEGKDVKLLGDGTSLVITGYTDRSVSGLDGSDLFIMKTNSSGTPTWTYAYNLSTEDIGHRVVETSTGLAVMGTTFSLWGFSFLDMFLMKTNGTGSPVFGEIFSQTNPAHNYMADGQQTADGGFVMAGWGQSLSMDFLLIKTTAAGTTGCDEYPATPEQRTYNPPSATVTPVVSAIGSSTTKYGMVFTPAITTSNVCDTASPLIVDAGNDQSVCANQTITIGGNPTASGGSGTYTYIWTPSSYLNNSTVANPLCTPVTAAPTGPTTITYTVTVNDGNTTGTDQVTITVKPTPVVTSESDQTYCNGAPVPVNTLAGPVSGTTFAWTNNNTSIGLGAAGSGNIPAFTATNTGASSATGTVTITPTADGCTGTAEIYTITVYPTPSMTSENNQSFCHGAAVPANTLAGPVSGTTFTWTNSNTAIGLGASGSGNIPAFTATNTGTASISGTVSVTPTANGCNGPVSTYTITIHPPLTAHTHGDTSICTKTSPGIFTCSASGGSGSYTYLWYMNGTSTGVTSSTYSPGVLENPANFYCVVNNTCGPLTTSTFYVSIIPPVGTPLPITVSSGTEPVCQLTNSTTTTGYYTNASYATGYNWSVSNPAAGSINPSTGLMTWANGFYGTVDIQVTANGCDGPSVQVIRTVVINLCGTGHTISGKTRYAGKANAGNPAPNLPTYNSVIYDINKVIVILKNYPAGTELTRDTSDALGNYQFSNVANGSYLLTYDKYTDDTMQWGDNINAIDVALVKYFVGSDTLVDPSRCFSSKYKKVANVDNNTSINSIDVARLKAKVGNPTNPARNFPSGNWPVFDTLVTVAGADISLILKTICYGDYNASSTKYRDSVANWSQAKSSAENIVAVADDYINSSPGYFEVPLRISTKINAFSALGLELYYPAESYILVGASMPGTAGKNDVVKLNPTLEEIIAGDDDLLVTDEHGVIRVVFATTNHFDVAANDEILRLGFRSLRDMEPGESGFILNGTGVIGDQYGEENDEAYLTMPRIFVQAGNTDTEFEFAGYPNPFNDNAIVDYYLPEDGSVKISVYNNIGEQVSVLVNEVQAFGKHTAEFASAELARGMYTFKLEFTGVNKSKCLILKLIH